MASGVVPTRATGGEMHGRGEVGQCRPETVLQFQSSYRAFRRGAASPRVGTRPAPSPTRTVIGVCLCWWSCHDYLSAQLAHLASELVFAVGDAFRQPEPFRAAGTVPVILCLPVPESRRLETQPTVD